MRALFGLEADRIVRAVATGFIARLAVAAERHAIFLHRDCAADIVKLECAAQVERLSLQTRCVY